MIGCIIQARMGSSRLPGKVMMELNNSKSLLYYVIKQHQFCNEIDKIVVATTDQKNDDIIENYVNKLGIECYRGDSINVLDRFYQCAKKYSFPTIVRITADNPFNDPTIVDSVIKKFKSNNFDYITNSKPRTFPQGISVEVFSFKTLEIAWNNAKLPSEKNMLHHTCIIIQKISKSIIILRVIIYHIYVGRLIEKMIMNYQKILHQRFKNFP